MDWTRVPALFENVSAFRSPLDDDDGTPLFASHSLSFESPVAQVQTLLIAALEREVATPLLEASTEGEFIDRLVEGCIKFTETRTTYRVLQRQWRLSPVDREAHLQSFLLRAEQLKGPAGVDTCDFAAATYHRALALAKSIQPLDRATVIELRKRDRELASAFRVFADIFQCVRYVIFAAAERDRLPSATGIECVFEILGGSARQAYITARERAELRRTPDGDLSPLPFDDEDRYLADLVSP